MKRLVISVSQKKIKQKRGITLIEIVIVVAILGLISLAASTVFFSGLGMFGQSTDESLASQEIRIISTHFTNQLKFARKADISASESIKSTANTHYFSIELYGTDLLFKSYNSDGEVVESRLISSNVDNFSFDFEKLSRLDDDGISQYLGASSIIVNLDIRANDIIYKDTFSFAFENNYVIGEALYDSGPFTDSLYFTKY